MHILFIKSFNPFYENGASANRFAGLIKGLLNHDIKITMLITGGYNNFNEFKLKGLVHGYNNLTVYYSNHLFNNNIWFRRLNKYVLSKLTNKRNSKFLKKYLDNDFDYIWLTKDSSILSIFNNYYKNIKGKTLIELNEFNDIHKSNAVTVNKLQYNAADIADEIFKKAAKRIDCFAVMTTTLINHYRAFTKPNAQFMHLPMTVDLKRFQSVDTTDLYKKPYIAYTGTFNNAKDGVDILIHSFANISQKYPSLHLYLAGFYHYDVDKQKEIINKYNLNDRITYLGVLSKEEIPPFICNAELLVLSRPDSHQAQGGFPTKLGEYLATGRPVCVTKVGEIPNYLEDDVSAFLAEPGDVNSFTDAMDRALSNPEKARKVGLTGREVAKIEFNSEIQAQRLADFLKQNLEK